MDDDFRRDVGQLRHLSESVLYSFVRELLKGAAAAEVADHLERCLACRVWATRLGQAAVSEPDEPIISRLVDASPAVPEAILRVVTADATSAAPGAGELWRVGRDEALLVWVRRVFDDSASVLPVTFDGDLADDFSLIISDSESPLGLEIVVMASVEAEVDLRAFLQRVSVLPVDEQMKTLRDSRRSGLPVPSGFPVGVPIVSEQDQRIEYRQVLSDLLADMSPGAFAAEAEVESTDDGLDVHQFIEDLRGLTFHREDVTVRELRLDQMSIDPAHQVLLVALVEDLDLVILVAVLTGADSVSVLTQPELARRCGSLLRQRPEANAVAVAIPDGEWTAVVVGRAFATEALEAPSGRLSQPRVAFQPLALVDALLKYFDGHASRWGGAEAVNFHREPLDIVELGSTLSARAIERTVADGKRALTPAKKSAYTSLGGREAVLISEMIEAVTGRGVSPIAAVDRLLDGSSQ